MLAPRWSSRARMSCSATIFASRSNAAIASKAMRASSAGLLVAPEYFSMKIFVTSVLGETMTFWGGFWSVGGMHFSFVQALCPRRHRQTERRVGQRSDHAFGHLPERQRTRAPHERQRADLVEHVPPLPGDVPAHVGLEPLDRPLALR